MAGLDPEHGWLPLGDVRTWLKVASGSTKGVLADTCRKAAASWIEDQRKDLIDSTADPDAPVFKATDRIVMAGMLATARLFARIDSPNGVVAFDELGAGSILSKDPDIAKYLGRAKWMVG